MAYIHHIATLTPPYRYRQEAVCQLMQEYLGADRRVARQLERIYCHSAIDTRYSVLSGLTERQDGLYFRDGCPRVPTTAERNRRYAEAAKKLFGEVAERLLAPLPEGVRGQISHVITVSCTGFFAPGPEHHVVQAAGLNPAAARYHLGFMGCYAVLPALKLARALCRAEPQARVLVIAVELCTLHLQRADDTDSLVSGAVFADGAAAALVAAEPAAGLRLDGFATAVLPRAAGEMAWTIADSGFVMRLSRYVPDILKANVAEAVAPLLEQAGLPRSAIDRWAVHPGGRAILDKVEAGLSLCAPALAASRKVLRDYGNMSSVTSLFVLNELWAAAPGERICALAFGPGLTVESALLTRV